MKDNTVIVDGVEVYTTRIQREFDNYLQSMDIDPSDTQAVTPSLFAGACKAVYLAVFAPDTIQKYNANTRLDTSDISAIEAVWQVYTGLCYKYAIRPTMLRFSVLTGISQDTFATWNRQEYRGSYPHSEWYKKARAECESAVVDAILQSNSIGGIFIAKSRYGYRETAPVTDTYDQIASRDSPEQIAARHATATLPQKPILEEG